MRLWTDGAEYGDGLGPDTISGIDISTAQKRSGAYSYLSNNNAEYFRKNFTASSDIYIRIGFYTTINTGTGRPIATLYSAGGTVLGSIQWATGGQITIYSGTTLRATSVFAILINTWYCLEAHFKIDDVNGSLEIKIDGNLDGSFSGDTKPGADTTYAYIIYANTGSSSTYYYDDLAINNTDNSDGLNDNSWCGDGKIELIKANGNGYISQWTGQDGDSVNNYLNVDEIPSDNDTTYNEDSTATNKDAYTLEDWTGTSKIPLRVWVEGRIRDTVAAGNQVKLGVRSGGANYMSGNLSLVTSYMRVIGTAYKTDPADAAAWTDADIDALEAVIETV